MGFFSFGKKKKNETASAPPVAGPAKNHLRRPSNLVNSASASSSLSADSSGSSSGSPPQPPIRAHAFSSSNDKPQQQQRSLSFSPESMVPLVPRIPSSTPHSRAASSTSLNGPIAPYANRDLQKKGSTNTLNSMRSTASNSKRGAHDAPRIAPELAALAKPRASSYHANQVRNIWVTSAATDAGHSMGHSTVQAHNGGNAKYYSTGSPGLMNRGSSYFNAQGQAPQHPAVSDPEFKTYTKKYDTAIAKAHTLAREYHHLPPAKRDRPRFEHIGHAFAAAALISREHWSYRCGLEKERLEALLRGGKISEEDVDSIHRVAGARATEGWQYASMLADAWGVKDEVNTPLEDMPVLKPTYTTYSHSYSSHSPSAYYPDRGASYVHPGYTQSGYASYIAQPTTAPASATEFGRSKYDSRDRMDSTASAVSASPSLDSYAHSSSSHTHSGLSHSLQHSKSHQGLSSTSTPPAATSAAAWSSYSSTPSYVPSPLKSTTNTSNVPPVPAKPMAKVTPSPATSVVEQPAVRGPIVLTKGRRYRERGGSLAGAATVTVS